MAFYHYTSRLAVINTQGEVWERKITGSSIGAADKLDGPGLFGGPNDIEVVGLSGHIAVITNTGDVWVRSVGEDAVGNGNNVGNIFGGPNHKYILSDGGGCIFVVNTAGELWGHNLDLSATKIKIGGGYKINGPSLFGGPGDKYVVFDKARKRVLVVTNQGEVWAHDLSNRGHGSSPQDTIGSRYKLNGPSLFGGPGDIEVVYLPAYSLYFVYGEPAPVEPEKFLVITNQGEVWARTLGDSTVSAGVKLDGGLFGGPNYKYVIGYENVQPIIS